MEALEKCVRGIKADGLLWGAGKKMLLIITKKSYIRLTTTDLVLAPFLNQLIL